MTKACGISQKYDHYSPRTAGQSSGGLEMSQKKWKFNVIDVIVVVLIVAVAALLVMKFAGGET